MVGRVKKKKVFNELCRTLVVKLDIAATGEKCVCYVFWSNTMS